MKNKGISNILSYITISIVLLIIGFSIYYIVFQQYKIGQSVITSEEKKGESQLLEKLSLIYWGEDGAILSNDGEIKIIIKKIYVDNKIVTTNIEINPNEKKQISIPFGENLMIETSYWNLFKFEKNKPIMIENSEKQTFSSIMPTIETSISYLKTTYTSTITTTIPIQTYSYRTTTKTSYTTITTIFLTTTVMSHPYPYSTTIIYITTKTLTSTYKYTLTIVSPYTSYTTKTYITETDPIIPLNKNKNYFVATLIMMIFLLILFYPIIFDYFKKVFL